MRAASRASRLVCVPRSSAPARGSTGSRSGATPPVALDGARRPDDRGCYPGALVEPNPGGGIEAGGRFWPRGRTGRASRTRSTATAVSGPGGWRALVRGSALPGKRDRAVRLPCRLTTPWRNYTLTRRLPSARGAPRRPGRAFIPAAADAAPSVATSADVWLGQAYHCPRQGPFAERQATTSRGLARCRAGNMARGWSGRRAGAGRHRLELTVRQQPSSTPHRLLARSAPRSSASAGLAPVDAFHLPGMPG